MNAPTELIQKNSAFEKFNMIVNVFHIKIFKLLFFQNTVAVGAEEH